MLALRRVAQLTVRQPLVWTRLVPASSRALHFGVRGPTQARRRATTLAAAQASQQAAAVEDKMASAENGQPAVSVSAEEVESLRKQLETLQVGRR